MVEQEGPVPVSCLASSPCLSGLAVEGLGMRAFADAWPDAEFVQQVVALLPWDHNARLLDAVKVHEQRAWYARQAIEHGWSRNVLAHQIDSNLFARQGSALTNFSQTLPAEQSELAQQILKDPYTFDFLALLPEMLERDLERGLIEHLRSRRRRSFGHSVHTRAQVVNVSLSV